jgi:hypothetical protein
MRRLFVTVIALLLVLGTAAAPATAKRDKPDKPGPSLAFGVEPYAGYQPELSICVADVPLQVEGAGKGSLVTFEAFRMPDVLLDSQETTLRTGGSSGLLFSYDFPCESEIQLDITHVATLKDRKGKELASAQETHTMNFEVHR